jgi:hypothetical protein
MPKNDRHYGSSQFRSFGTSEESTVRTLTAGFEVPGERSGSRPYRGTAETRPPGKVTPSRKVNNLVPKGAPKAPDVPGHSDSGDFSAFYANNTGEYISPEDRVVAEAVLGGESNVIST